MNLFKSCMVGALGAFIAVVPNLGIAKTILKLGHNAAPTHHYHITSLKFKEAVEQRTNGELEIKIFPADQLGSLRQLTEGAQLGTTDMVVTSDAMLSNFEEQFAALTMPFLFRDMDHVGKTMDGEIGNYFADLAEKKGIVILGYWENGFRVITNSKRPINTVEDMQGLKLRISPGFLAVDTFNAFGMQPTPMATGEVYSALQLGTVDGQENAMSFVLSQKYYEVQEYLSVTHHMHNVEPLIISKIVYDSLKPEFQQVLREEARKLAPFSRGMVQNQEEELIKELNDKIKINRITDTSGFEMASQVVYDKYKDKFGDLIEKIKAIQ